MTLCSTAFQHTVAKCEFLLKMGLPRIAVLGSEAFATHSIWRSGNLVFDWVVLKDADMGGSQMQRAGDPSGIANCSFSSPLQTLCDYGMQAPAAGDFDSLGAHC